MSFLQRATRHPSIPLGAGHRGRREWRRTVQRVVAEHHHQTTAQLRDLRGAPVLGVSTTPRGTLELTLPGWAITLVGVSASGRDAVAAVGGRSSWLSDSGNYGPFWWLEVCAVGVAGCGPLRAVALGAPIRLVPDRWAPDTDPLPAGPQSAGSPLVGPAVGVAAATS